MTKTQITRGLRGGTALSALVLAGTLFAAPAVAQDAAGQPGTQNSPAETTAQDEQTTQSNQDNTGGDIVVTGSLFRRTNAETPSPVTVMSAESLQQRGINTVAEAVQRVSANGAGNITQGWNTGSNFATGANAVSLRGLTVQSTLTIFDGLRMAPYPLADDGSRNFVDLNTIPNAIIDRIEILRDGASSTYGADAVAGVVNVITKKEIQGLHLNASAGISQQGDAAEQRFDATYGYGNLDEQGFNFYVNGEYQRQEALYARDRGYPFNTSDLSRVCGTANGQNPLFPSGSKVCQANGVRNALTPNTGAAISPTLYPFTYNGTSATPVASVRPVDAAGAAVPGQLFRLLNTAAGCRDLTPIQVPLNGQGGTATAGGTLQCSLDARATYSQLQPEQERLGFAGRFTAKLGDDIEFYAAGNYYQVKTATTAAPSGFTGSLPTPNPQGFAQPSNLFLPVYVCAAGQGSLTNLNTGCTAANGTLNPQNPFAAAGQRAQVLQTYDRERRLNTEGRSLRAAMGVSGTFGDGWGFEVEASASQVQLDVINENVVIPQRLWNAAARGQYNFSNPAANTQAVRDYVAPLSKNRSVSDLWQVSATLQKELFQLPGGALGVAAGVAYRHESIDNPSANPENLQTPYDRYFVINAVGAVGSREVKSAFYEISAPIFDQLEVSASGRYDDYSSGQSNFSPKFGAKFTPIPQLAVRGTWSKGFRIPSFNEAFGLPTTGYVTFTLNRNDPAQAAFIAAHGGNAYATAGFPVGLTSTGNPSLDPEKSTSWTVGGIFEPIRNVSFTVDYWNIEVRDIIGGADYSGVQAAYYANNGVVNIPGLNVLPGVPDINFPNALPHLGFIEYSFQNNDSQRVSGIDLGANVRFPFLGATFNSSFEASYLMKFEKTIGGNVQRYDGTLSPCDVTSCSGAPKWRGSWQNTVEVGGFTGSVTAYYTDGYDLASVDYGGVKGDCLGSLGNSISTYQDGTTPVLCEAKAQWNVDLSLSQRVSDNFTIYANVLNVLGIDPVYDPSAAYHIFQFNPSWGGPNIMGRYFRVGARVSF
ncbi:TonB-dependent receptor domain-containing protein [Sphingomonas sp. M1-B02]|uniref:TonB-dependent receptor domain-containing protein n=1 Tax=Sphingomonas sp. M1-B02 TaxID=3114300 RepID=UPI002240C4ED|nr:TonB-dependent receptor [Sphingomonas sp. S6-11]UZK65743.1 TonB-dependent receptor [Sphingomonas sp. S6-11]